MLQGPGNTCYSIDRKQSLVKMVFGKNTCLTSSFCKIFIEGDQDVKALEKYKGCVRAICIACERSIKVSRSMGYGEAFRVDIWIRHKICCIALQSVIKFVLDFQ